MPNKFKIKNNKERKRIRMEGEVGSYYGEGTTSDYFRYLISEYKGQDFEIVLDSMGGSIFEGQKISNIIRAHDGHVTCIINGSAFSIASMIAASCGTLKCMKNSKMMIHNVQYSAAGKTPEQMEEDLKLCKNLRDEIAEVLANKSGVKDKEYFLELMTDNVDHYFTADEAQEIGLVDEVIEPEQFENKKTQPQPTTTNTDGKNEAMDKLQEFANLGKEHGVSLDRVLELSEDTTVTNSGEFLQRVYADKLSELKPKNEGNPLPAAGTRVHGSDEVEMVTNALKNRAGMEDLAHNNSYKGAKLMDAARAFSDKRGSDRFVAENALMSTDLHKLVGEIVDFKVKQEKEKQVRLNEKFCVKRTPADFNVKKDITLNDISEMEKKAEGEDYAKTTLTSSDVIYKVDSYGKDISFTREFIINDNFDILQSVPAKQVKSGYAASNRLIINTILEKSGLYTKDFNKVVNNFDFTSSIDKAFELMSSHTNTNKQNSDLGITPQLLLCSPRYYQRFKHAMFSEKINGELNTAYQVIPEIFQTNLLSGLDGAIVVAADSFDSVLFATLAGYDSPTVETHAPVKTGDDMILRSLWDFGTAISDKRGLVKIEFEAPKGKGKKAKEVQEVVEAEVEA